MRQGVRALPYPGKLCGPVTRAECEAMGKSGKRERFDASLHSRNPSSWEAEQEERRVEASLGDLATQRDPVTKFQSPVPEGKRASNI